MQTTGFSSIDGNPPFRRATIRRGAALSEPMDRVVDALFLLVVGLSLVAGGWLWLNAWP
jgi:hypothetical protein